MKFQIINMFYKFTNSFYVLKLLQKQAFKLDIIIYAVFSTSYIYLKMKKYGKII